MVTVATGPTVTYHSDENFCEKYPTNSDCDTNTLPMLIVVPTFSSYLSSESLLGLGDIVLPGLLLVWAARYSQPLAIVETRFDFTLQSYLTKDRPSCRHMINIFTLHPPSTSRLDIRRYGSLSSPYASRGHFPMVVFGYAIGLMAANFAVSYFEVSGTF